MAHSTASTSIMRHALITGQPGLFCFLNKDYFSMLPIQNALMQK
ncbi:unnamed protein product, partial [Rotaria magnacalcarata]